MNIFGIGPGEIFLILIMLLVVVGPERLPGFARQAGQLLVRGRNWLQQSPDAALVLRARQELEQELATIRASLLEVQNVRDEVVGAAKQLNESVAPLTSSRIDLDNLLGVNDHRRASSSAEQQKTGSDGETTASTTSAADHSPDAPSMHLESAHEAASPSRAETTSAQPDPQMALPIDRPMGVGLSFQQIEELNLRLQAVMADLWALQEQLKQRGILNGDWQPPSIAMHLPSEPPASQPSAEEIV